jgi:hypothetical protein
MMRDNSRPAGPARRGVRGRRRSISWSSPEPPPYPPARTIGQGRRSSMELLRLSSPSAWTPWGAAPNAPTTGPNRMGQPDPDRPDRRVDKVFASASRSGPRGTEGYRRLVVGKGSLMVQRAACSAGAHHRGLETGGHLHVQSSQCCIRTGWVSAAWGERLTDVPGWLALPRSQDRHNPRSGPRMPCWRGCRPEGLQEGGGGIRRRHRWHNKPGGDLGSGYVCTAPLLSSD